jgi:hypothetical protein
VDTVSLSIQISFAVGLQSELGSVTTLMIVTITNITVIATNTVAKTTKRFLSTQDRAGRFVGLSSMTSTITQFR